MVSAETGFAVEEGGGAFGGETVFVGVAADACDAFEGEVEWDGGESGAGEEGHEEGAETAIYVKGEGFAEGEAREGGDVVDYAVGEGGGGADEEDGVAVDESGDAGDVDAVGWTGASHEVDFDAEIGARFVERWMGGFGDDPRRYGYK